MHFSRGRINLS